MSASWIPTIGVEEEYFLVDPASRFVRAAGEVVVRRAAAQVGELVSGEFTEYQLEMKTPPCTTADQLRTELVRVRAAANSSAAEDGLRICASGVAVLADAEPPPIGVNPRYGAGLAQYRTMMHDFAVSSLHVHVHLPESEVAVRVINHLRPWLPLLLSLSANSPFHRGEETGYADWRATIRSRFPCLGPPPYAVSLRHQERLAVAIAQSGAMLDARTPFWDIRLNSRVSTLEVRAMDVCADVDDAVALAVLVRALVMTVAPSARAGDPGPRPSAELLRAAYWRAARDGWCGSGVDAISGQMLPAAAQAARLMDFVGAAADAAGDASVLAAFMERLAIRGTGAELQRSSAGRRGAVTDVIDDLITLTARA